MDKSLREIINELGNKSYRCIDIMHSIKLTKNARTLHDSLIAVCSYDASTQTLTGWNDNTYSLNNKFYTWEEGLDIDDTIFLTVWCH